MRGHGVLGFHFCSACGCVAYWRSRQPEPGDRWRIAVNLRLAELDDVRVVPVEHFDGLTTFTDLGQDGRCVSDVWF